jgi:hypothetical protein
MLAPQRRQICFSLAAWQCGFPRERPLAKKLLQDARGGIDSAIGGKVQVTRVFENSPSDPSSIAS